MHVKWIIRFKKRRILQKMRQIDWLNWVSICNTSDLFMQCGWKHVRLVVLCCLLQLVRISVCGLTAEASDGGEVQGQGRCNAAFKVQESSSESGVALLFTRNGSWNALCCAIRLVRSELCTVVFLSFLKFLVVDEIYKKKRLLHYSFALLFFSDV